MNALVVYQSKTGTTKRMANEIAAQLEQNNASVKVASIEEVSHDEFLSAEQIYIVVRLKACLFLAKNLPKTGKSLSISCLLWLVKEL